MGTFQGHALPGSFFIVFSLWWITQIPRRMLICQQGGIPFYTTATYPFFCLKCPAESVVKLLATGLGMLLELLASTDYGRNGAKIIFWSDLQHVSMYLMFFVASVIEIMRYRNCVSVPAGSEFLANALAFSSELMLFSFHLYGRSGVDTLSHQLLLYAIAGCVLSILLELKYRENLLAACSRAYFTFLQGTWIFQVGFLLYPPTPHLNRWKGDDPEDMMIITMMFAWHCAVDFILIMCIFIGTSIAYKKHGGVGTRRLNYELLDYADTEFETHLQESIARHSRREEEDSDEV